MRKPISTLHLNRRLRDDPQLHKLYGAWDGARTLHENEYLRHLVTTVEQLMRLTCMSLLQVDYGELGRESVVVRLKHPTKKEQLLFNLTWVGSELQADRPPEVVDQFDDLSNIFGL